MDARTINPELFTQAFPAETDLIITSSPMLPRHLPRTHRRQGQPAQAAVGQIRYIIQHLAATQEDGIGFIWDTPVGSPLPAHVQQLMGPSTVLNAHKCGSGAHRPTHFWQNLLPKEELEEAYSNTTGPPHTVNEMLDHAGLSSWKRPLGDTTNSTANPPTILPRFRTGPTPPPRAELGQSSTA
jgi:hypothetical protein